MVEELKTIEMGFSDYIAIKQKEFDWLRQGKEEGRQEGYAHVMVTEGTNLPLETIQELRDEINK